MKYIISFFGNLAANLLSLAVFFLIVPAFAVAAIFAFLLAQFGLAPSGTPDNAAIVLNLSDAVCEFAPPTDALSNLKRGGAASSVLSICSKIEAAARDDSNKLVFISGSFDCAAEDVSYAQIAELRAALHKYAESGKEVVAYLENPSTRDYFLASAATTVFLNPFSELEFKGLGGNAAFFGNALKKYGVEVEVVKVGALKSFGEMFTSDKMSEPVRENYAGLLDSVWNSVLESVAKSRKISAAALAGVAEKKAVLSAADALAARLVDRLAYRDEVIDYISEKVGADGVSFAQISVADYEFPECGPDCVGVVAVVYLNGEISAGKTRKRHRGRRDVLRALARIALRRKRQGGGFARQQRRRLGLRVGINQARGRTARKGQARCGVVRRNFRKRRVLDFHRRKQNLRRRPKALRGPSACSRFCSPPRNSRRISA